MLRAIARQLAPAPSAGQQHEIVTDVTAVAPPSPWHAVPMFVDGARGGLTPEQRAQMDIDGHIVLPGIITEETTARAIAALARVDQIAADFAQSPAGRRQAELRALVQQKDVSEERKQQAQQELREWGPDGSHGNRMSINQVIAEHDEYLESIVGHPEMLALAKSVLGDDIRFDHQCGMSKDPGNGGMGYHPHNYADEVGGEPGMIRVRSQRVLSLLFGCPLSTELLTKDAHATRCFSTSTASRSATATSRRPRPAPHLCTHSRR